MALTRITKGVIKPNENYDTHNINSTGIVTAVGANFSGNVSVGGVLTYEDVTNIDSVGIVTARQGILIDDSISHIGDTNTKIRFPANDKFTVETAGVERFRIADDGRIGINDNTPNDYELDILKRSGVTDANIRLYNNDTTSTSDTIMRYQIGGTTANNYIYFGDINDVNAGQIRYSHSNNFLSVHTNAAERIRIDSDGFVGIGTNNPDHNLHVFSGSGDAVITIESTGNGNHSALEFMRTSSGGDSKGAGSIYVTGDTSESAAKMKFGVAHNIGHGTFPKMTIEGANGRVGIGTESPTDILDVYSTTDPTIRSRSGSSSVGANIEICGGASNDSQLIFSAGTTAKYQIFRDGSQSDDLRIYDSTNTSDVMRYRYGGYLLFGVNGEERVRIKSNGYVGIGTNNPLTHVDIYATPIDTATLNTTNSINLGLWVRAKNPSNTTGNIYTGITLGEGRAGLYAYDDGGGAAHGMGFWTGSNSGVAERLRIKSDGKVGIGTNNPLSLLSLYSDSDGEALLHFDMGDATNRRGWKFKQGNTGTATELVLQADANGKVFQIESASGAEMFYAYTATSGGFVRINPELHISDYIKHIGDHDTNIRFPADNTFTVETAGSERLRIKSDGKVGIGTNNPQGLLHLQGEGGDASGLYFKNGPHDVVRQYFNDGNDNSDFLITYSGTGGAEITLQQTGNVILNKSNGGKVVIGNTAVTPDNPLIIAAASASAILEIQRSSANTTGAIGALNFTAVDGHSVANIYALGDGDNEGAHLVFKTTSASAENSPYGGGTTERLRITSDGDIYTSGNAVRDDARLTIEKNKVGVSTAIHIHNSNGSGTASKISSSKAIILSADVENNTSADRSFIAFETDNTEKVRIANNGFVGIGSDIPKSLLDVRGDINFQNFALISNFDSNGVGGSNIDHIWHSDGTNYGRGGTWNFVSDSSYKATGNSVIQIGYLSCSGGAHFAANNVAIGLTTVSRGPLHVHNNSGDDCQIHMTNNDTGTTTSDGMTLFTDTDTSGIWSREDVPFDIATVGTRSIRLHNTGGLSINTTSKSTNALLHVDNHGDRNTISDVSDSSQYVIVNDCHFGGSGGSLSGNRSKAGIRNDIEFTSTTPSTTASGNRFSVFGIHNDVHATKFAYVTDGLYSFVKQAADNQPSSNNTATVRGVYGYAQGYCTNTQGNVNVYGGYFLGYRGGDVNAGHVYGVYARAHNTNGSNNTGDLTGVYSEWEQDEGTTITNAYCFRGYGDRDAGTITNGYILNGSFGGDGSITNRYGVYISDSNKNRLGGELTVTGDLVVNGSSKQFRIPHPIVGLSTTKDLVHAAIEGPQIDLIYRGKVDLVNGTATVNLDTKSRMTEGTFVLLNRDVQCFTTNETGWTNVKGSVTGNQLTIIAQENTCTDTISWMVIGERQDDAVKQSTSTNDDGKLIMEPLKEILPDADFEQPECEKNIYNEE